MTVEEARQCIISQADIMCESCGRDCKEWCGDREALEIAAEALNKRHPQKAVPNLWDEWFECPSCGGIVSSEDETLYAYCPDCGQKITLEEDNED